MRFYNRKNTNLFKWKNLQPKKKRFSIYRSILQQKLTFIILSSKKESQK